MFEFGEKIVRLLLTEGGGRQTDGRREKGEKKENERANKVREMREGKKWKGVFFHKEELGFKTESPNRVTFSR